jgi:hypothetical protein
MSQSKTNITIGVFLICALGIAGWYMLREPFLKFMSRVDQPTPIESATDVQEVQLEGTLLVSLIPKNVEDGRAAIYRVNIATGGINLENDSNDFYAPTLTHDRSRVAVVGTDGDDTGVLFVADITKPEDAAVYMPPAPAIWAGVANWSSKDDFIAYDALAPVTAATDTAMENSYVVVLNPANGNQRILDMGTSPVFAPDDSIVYLKHDGIYRQRMSNGAPEGEVERLALFEGFFATRNSQIALSPDGSTIVVTHPESAIVLTYAVFGADGMTALSAPLVAEASVAWPVFSPDGNKIAYVSLDTAGDTARADELTVVDRTTGTKYIVMSFDEYDNTHLAVRDWIE